MDKIKALVVDDEQELRKFLVEYLNDHNIETIEASDGVKAFEMLKDHKVDFVLSDVRMPAGSGIELLSRMGKNLDFLPQTILITGLSNLQVEDIYSLGACALLNKPFDYDELLDLIQKFRTPLKQRIENANSTDKNIESLTTEFKSFDHATFNKYVSFGKGGIFISCQGPFPKLNSEIKFNIIFSDGDINQLSGRGIVRWSRSENQDRKIVGGIGLEYTWLPEETLAIALERGDTTVSFIPNCRY